MNNNSGINKVLLLGRIDSEPRWAKTGVREKELHFTLVTDEYIGKFAEQHSEYHQIVLAECDFLKLHVNLECGQWLHITGKVQTISSYDEDRVKRYRTFIQAQQITVINFDQRKAEKLTSTKEPVTADDVAGDPTYNRPLRQRRKRL